jgi:hypothetical protein
MKPFGCCAAILVTMFVTACRESTSPPSIQGTNLLSSLFGSTLPYHRGPDVDGNYETALRGRVVLGPGTAYSSGYWEADGAFGLTIPTDSIVDSGTYFVRHDTVFGAAQHYVQNGVSSTATPPDTAYYILVGNTLTIGGDSGLVYLKAQ